MSTPTRARQLLHRATCPHCWGGFAPEQSLWVSEHTDLLGDPFLGSEKSQRFLPTRFTLGGDAIDARGMVCRSLACPHCHLGVPRGLLEMETTFLSILGAASSGKSYFLAAMLSQLRQVLPFHFAVSFTDVDPETNRILNACEEALAQNAEAEQFIPLSNLIIKTEEQGDMYDMVSFGPQTVRFPRPFLFALYPQDGHPQAPSAREMMRMLCLYDNAGEHFEPGKDDAKTPVTRHLAQSRALLFVFDPTQSQRFRAALRARGAELRKVGADQRLRRQELILNEAAARVRRHAGLGQSDRHDRPLIVVVTKWDQWTMLFPADDDAPPWKKVLPDANVPAGLDVDRINDRSRQLRKLLVEFCPEVVAAAEGFAKEVLYVAVSALGPNVELDPATGAAGIRPERIEPQWVTVPFLYALTRILPGLIPRLKRKAPKG